MKKFAQLAVNLALTVVLTSSTLFLATAGAYASEAEEQNLTIAAAEISTEATKTELRVTEDLAEKTEALNKNVNAKLEKQLDAKLASTFNL
ncbi:hypothetical protein [Cellvibrio mixtus]|uniref:hypothetical protein n=1 Tax=Cellvibrio mixtus TaxID=39650 RepID=UPI0005873342|nr:hypothetical protein [Cellvibrio mixtus]